MNSLRLELPLSVSVNSMYKRRRDGGVRLSDEARAFKQEARLIAANAAQLTGWQAPEYLELEFWFYVPTARTDGDNLVKTVQDSIADALGFNDRRVVDWRIHKRTDRENPRCVVVVREAVWPVECG